jgi:hypothetical protein
MLIYVKSFSSYISCDERFYWHLKVDLITIAKFSTSCKNLWLQNRKSVKTNRAVKTFRITVHPLYYLVAFSHSFVFFSGTSSACHVSSSKHHQIAAVAASEVSAQGQPD